MCYICFAIGKPIALTNVTYEAACKNKPLEEAMVLIEMDILDPRPAVIMVSLSVHPEDEMGRVNVQYN